MVFYDTFYYPNLCHVCKRPDKNIKRCSICKSLAYCSKEHQAQDWKHHKILCKIMAYSEQHLGTNVVKGFKDYNRIKVMRSVMWLNHLNRKLKHFEDQIWMFPRVCVVCYSKYVISDCQNCLNVSYCSEEHENLVKERHSKFCKALKLCMDMDLYYFHEEIKPNKLNVKNFKDDVKTLPSSLELLMYLYEDCSPINVSKEKVHFIIKADLLAPSATILYGLEQSGLIKDRFFTKTSLTVHIIGADTTELCWLWNIILELPFHWIKNIKILTYFVIGPELGYDGSRQYFSTELCETCSKMNIKMMITFKPNLYHDIVNTIDKPDVIVAFNSGIHEFHSNIETNTWKNSLTSLTKYPEVPIILTAYTMEEIIKDVEILKHNCTRSLEIILKAQQNPFSNMRPIRDWETENNPVFYINGYIAVLLSR